MKLPRYELIAEKSMMVFEFVSEGQNGNIHKLIKFSPTTIDEVYNLAFGDKDSYTGDIDDHSVSNNGDSEQVLATVVSAVFVFLENHPGAWVYATGSTKTRNRLYRMGIAKYLDQVKSDYLVYGLYNGEWQDFTKDIEYSAFIIRRK
jgi:hypothetical protein